MASNYQLKKALYKQIKSKDLSVSITAGDFFRLVKLDDDTFLLNIDIQTNKGNITIKGLTKDNFNSYNTTSDIELSIGIDNIVYVKNTSTTETFIITSTSIELVKGILNESYFDRLTTDPVAVRIFNSKTDKGTFNGVVGSSSRINSDVSSFSDRLYVSGATTLGNILNVAGNLSIGTNKFNVTADSGDTYIAGTLNVDKAVTLGDTLNVTGLITGELDGNAATATALKTSRTIFGQSFNGTNDVTGDIIFGTLANKATLTYTTDTARTFTIPNTGANADFVMTQGNQTIDGVKTFNNSVTVEGVLTVGGNVISATPVYEPDGETITLNSNDELEATNVSIWRYE